MKREIAFFDFDGTITTKDTLLEFIKFSKGRRSFYLGMLANLPFLIAFKLKIISNQAAKEKLLRFFFSGTPAESFANLCSGFSRMVLPQLIRPAALVEINRLKASGTEVVVVSASPENWIRHWSESLAVQLVASRLEVKDDKITGRLMGKNCHGNEKVRRIHELYDLGQYRVVAAYGDTRGDKPMLQLAEKEYYKPFCGPST